MSIVDENRDKQKRSLRLNLETVFGVNFLAKVEVSEGSTNQEEEDWQDTMACEICYAVRLENRPEIPDRTCENSKCSRLFHSACLLEMCFDGADGAKSKDFVFVKCPYCTEPISIQVDQR